MEQTIYTLVKIEGEYAYLKKVGAKDEEELFIAMALLPLGVDIGSRIAYENFAFSLIE